MNVRPTIERELRVQARLPSNYGLRLLGAAALLAVTLVFAALAGFQPNEGSRLFGWLNFTLFISIWIIVPVLAADCISGERREGTIGLLFLTPLKARDIVLAKGLVHGLRALTLWLAVIPILTIPFLMGGLSWRELAMSVVNNFSALCLALAAGLLGSCFFKNWLRAQVLTCGLACVFAGVYVLAVGTLLAVLVYPAAGAGPSAVIFVPSAGSSTVLRVAAPSLYYGSAPYQYMNVEQVSPALAGVYCASDYGGSWGRMLSSLTPAAKNHWLINEGLLMLLAFLFLIIAVKIAAARLRRVWQEEPPSARQLWLQEALCTPVIGVALLRRWMRRKLDRNPIGWLEQRSWTGRLVTWSWLAMVVTLYVVIFGGGYSLRMIAGLQNVMALTLLLGVASSAAGSFHRERETGVMELLLVSPMTEGQIIGGRLRGLWGQFFPAIALMLGVWFYFGSLMPVWDTVQNDSGWRQFYLIGFFTVPVIGLYQSLRRKNFISAFLLTLLTGLCVPLLIRTFLVYVFFEILGLFVDINDDTVKLLSSFSVVNLQQLAIAFWYGRRLHRDLRDRNFAFSRAMA